MGCVQQYKPAANQLLRKKSTRIEKIISKSKEISLDWVVVSVGMECLGHLCSIHKNER